MNKLRFFPLIILTGWMIFTSCNSNSVEDPYNDILTEPAFSGLTDSISQYPKNDDLYFRRAILLNQKNYPEPALADFQKAWSLKKEEKYALGVSTLLLVSKTDSALLFLNKALKELPHSFLLQLSLARAYSSKNETDSALKICDLMLGQNPQQVDVLKLKADLLGKKGNMTEAVSTLEKAYNLTPFDIELNYMLALKYAETKNSRVLALCDSLIRTDTSGLHGDPYYYKGIYYSNINDKPKAISFFEEAVKHDYNFLDGYIEKAALLFDMKKYELALKTLNLALTISPEFPDTYYWIGKCQQALGQTENAKLNYQRAYSLDNTFIIAKDSANKLK